MRKLRIEVDTSAETGIDTWNYVDYVRVFGEIREIKPYPTPSPNPNSNPHLHPSP